MSTIPLNFACKIDENILFISNLLTKGQTGFVATKVKCEISRKNVLKSINENVEQWPQCLGCSLVQGRHGES